MTLLDAQDTPLEAWRQFRDLLVRQRIRDGLTIAQQDAVEIIITLYEFLAGGTTLAACMWSRFWEKLMATMDLAKRGDASMYLVSFIPWSQEIIVPWTIELQRV